MISYERNRIISELSAAIAPLISEALDTHPEHPEIDENHPLLTSLRVEVLKSRKIRTTAEAQAANDYLSAGALGRDFEELWKNFDPEKTVPSSPQLAQIVNTIGRWLTNSVMLRVLHTPDRQTPPAWSLLHQLLGRDLSTSLNGEIQTWQYENGLVHPHLRTVRRTIAHNTINVERSLFLKDCFSSQALFRL